MFTRVYIRESKVAGARIRDSISKQEKADYAFFSAPTKLKSGGGGSVHTFHWSASPDGKASYVAVKADSLPAALLKKSPDADFVALVSEDGFQYWEVLGLEEEGGFIRVVLAAPLKWNE